MTGNIKYIINKILVTVKQIIGEARTTGEE